MVSIIIVHYKVEKELIACISSILKSRPKIKFEIIAVDNDKKSKAEFLLKEKFPQVKYIKSSGNIGFGAGNNLGAKFATGDFLFFLNPDTIVEKNSIDILFNFMKNNPKSGMVAPLLFDPSGNVYPNQGSNEYNWENAIVIGSFINKFFPNNPISKKFFHKNWTKKEAEEFDVVPGTAFVIKKALFEKIGMFDEKIFLYFDEYDLAKRIRKLGYRNYIVPQAKVLHVWEASAKKRKDINKIFSQSRNYFFRKNYGRFFSFVIGLFSNVGKYEMLLGIILVLLGYLATFKINTLMVFIGDQGWFYLSARNMLLSGQIPLVGIASSHPWLHQGPFWTYLLALFLWLFNFNPVSGAYLTIMLGFLSVAGIYFVGSTLFSKRVGLIASLLYATSPLAVYYIRFPYHTSPIPLFVIILIFSFYKIVQGKLNHLPLAIFLLVILYNFEMATIALWGVLISVLMYKFFKNKTIVRQIFNKKIIFFSFFSLLAPLLPIILYDVRNGFPQTLKFTAWILYRAVSLLGYNPQQAFSINKIIIMLNFLFVNFTRLIFASSSLISFIIFIALISWIAYFVFKKKKKNSSFNLFLLLLFVPLFLITLNQTPSDAYLPMLFPIGILLVSIFFDYIMSMKKMLIPVLIFMVIVVFNNIYFMFKNNFALDGNSNMLTLDKRILISREILNLVGNKDYNLKGKGQGSEFASFTMNYEYLTWWLGHGPAKSNESLKVYISESVSGIKIGKNKNND